MFARFEPSKGTYQRSLASLADITLLPASLSAPQGTGNVVYFRISRWSGFGSQCLPLFRTRRFMQRCSSFSFMSFTQIVHDRGLYALVRVLVTCATSSSNSTVASRCRGPWEAVRETDHPGLARYICGVSRESWCYFDPLENSSEWWNPEAIRRKEGEEALRTSEREFLTTSCSLDIIISSIQECDDYVFGFNVCNSATTIYPGGQRSN